MKNLLFLFLFFLSLSCINASSSKNPKTDKYPPNLKKTVFPKSTVSKINTNKINKPVANYNSVPEWYLRNRVQIHTRLYLNDINSDSFFGFPKELSNYGVSVLTRQIKSGDEEPWWPSAVGTLNPLAEPFNQNGKNLAVTIIQQLHDLNMKSIIYYRHTEDAEMLKLHPDWAVKNANGVDITSKRGTYMCLNSPYRDVVITRLNELAKYGADGFYFDEIHIPANGCFCDYCKARYKKEYGSDLVADFKGGNRLQYFAFRNETIERFFSDIRNNLHSEGKDLVLLVSGNSWPTFTDLHMNSEIFHNFTLKSESEVPIQATVRNGAFAMPQDFSNTLNAFYWTAFCFSNMRDNSAGPPHIWCTRLRNENEAIQTSAALISLGCIANIDVEANRNKIDIIKTPVSWNKQFGDYFKYLVPYAYAGILVSENQRNKYVDEPDMAWKNVLIPAYNTFQKLYQTGIPLQIVSDAGSNDANLSKLKMIFCNTSLTAPKGMTIGKLNDINKINSLSGKNLAESIGAPMFCLKQDDQINLNYFKDNKGYIYIITGPDFTNNIRVNNDKVKQSLAKMQSSVRVSAGGDLKLYIKKSAITSNSVDNLINNNHIKSSVSDGDYYEFTLSPDYNSLGMFRFASPL